ncbi:MAG: hypothetical protein ACE5G7_06690 [Candidatus Hydrothermarchaeaceae archaeon]
MVVTRICDRCEKVIGDGEFWRVEIIKADKDNEVIPRTDIKNEFCDSCKRDYGSWLKGAPSFVETEGSVQPKKSIVKSILKG